MADNLETLSSKVSNGFRLTMISSEKRHRESREDTNRFKNSLVTSIDSLSNQIVSNQIQISEKENISRGINFELLNQSIKNLTVSVKNGAELTSSTTKSSSTKIEQAVDRHRDVAETSSKKHIATFNTYITTLYNVIDDFSQTLKKNLSKLTSKVIKANANHFSERKNYTRQNFESLFNELSSLTNTIESESKASSKSYKNVTDDLGKGLQNSIFQSSKNHSTVVHNSVTDFSQRLVKSIFDLSKETIKSSEDISTRQEMSYEKLLTGINNSISQSSKNHSTVVQNSVTDFSQRLVKSLFDLSKETIKSNEDISTRQEMTHKKLLTSIDNSISQSSKNHGSVLHNSLTDLHNSVTDFSQRLVKSFIDLSNSNNKISVREEMSYKQLLIMLYTKLGSIASEIQNMTLTNQKEMANSSMRIEKAIDSHRDVAESLSDKQSMLFNTSAISLFDKLVSSTDGISSSINKTSSDTDMVNKENFEALITNLTTLSDKQSMRLDTSVMSLLKGLEKSNDKLVSSTAGISSSINKTSMFNNEHFGALFTNLETFASKMENGLKHMNISTSNGLNTISKSIETSLKDVIQQILSDENGLRGSLNDLSTAQSNQLKMISDSFSSLSSEIPEKFEDFIKLYKAPFEGNAKIHNE